MSATRYDRDDCEDHGERHQWGPREVSRFAGTPNRPCRNCRCVSLDTDDDSY